MINKVQLLSALLKEGERFVTWREMQRSMMIAALMPDGEPRKVLSASRQKEFLQANLMYLRRSRQQVFGLICRLSKAPAVSSVSSFSTRRERPQRVSRGALPPIKFKGKPTVEQYVAALEFLFTMAERGIVFLVEDVRQTASFYKLLAALLVELRELIEFERSRGNLDQSPRLWRSFVRGLLGIWGWLPEDVALTLGSIAPLIPTDLHRLCGKWVPKSIAYKLFVAELIAEHSTSRATRRRCQNELIELIEEILGRRLYQFGAAHSLENLLDEGWWWEPQLDVLVDSGSIPQIASSFVRVIPQLGRISRVMWNRLYNIVYVWTYTRMSESFAAEYSEWIEAGVFEHSKVRCIQFKADFVKKFSYRDRRKHLRLQMLDEVDAWTRAAIAWRIIHADRAKSQAKDPDNIPPFHFGYGFRAPLPDIMLKAKLQKEGASRGTMSRLQPMLWEGEN